MVDGAPHGGAVIADVLAAQGVRFLFTLCGGHISPILVGAKHRGIRVVDVRDEASAVFAADAVARLTGVPGVAAVTAGPGATNAITAVKNAQLAQTPVVLLGGAAATILKGRGALQDIDQLALFRPHVKHAVSVGRVRDLPPAVTEAFRIAQRDVPGPVFVECPVDLLYEEREIRKWYAVEDAWAAGLARRLRRLYLRRHLKSLFAGADRPVRAESVAPEIPAPAEREVERAAARLRGSRRPVLLIGSQALLEPTGVGQLADAVSQLAIPVYLSGLARGLLGREHRLQLRHRRREALREADLVILAGVPCDFRLGYGRDISSRAALVAVNRSGRDLVQNRRPTLGVLGDPGRLLRRLAAAVPAPAGRWEEWREQLRQRDRERDAQIDRQAAEDTEFINPLVLCQSIERALDDESVLVLDGGDFVATASYIVSPRKPLSFLDPGPFGTLGVGAGFALGAKLCRPEAEVWILYGDGSAAYSLAEFDTFARHGVPVIAVVGTDACWTQIARGQREILKDDVGTVLRRTDYHRVVQGYGGVGLLVDRAEDVEHVLAEAKAAAKAGRAVLVNALIGETEFRKGSISL